jgi:hypothetical protein
MNLRLSGRSPMVPQLHRAILVGSLISSLSSADNRAVSVGQSGRTLTIPVNGPAAAVRCEYFVDLQADPPASGVMDWGRRATRPGSVVINTAPVGRSTTRLKLAFVSVRGLR